MDQRILVLSGTTTEINEKLNNLRYKNQMFDTRKYTDLVTLWIKGFPTLPVIGEHQFESLSDPIILFAAVSFIWFSSSVRISRICESVYFSWALRKRWYFWNNGHGQNKFKKSDKHRSETYHLAILISVSQFLIWNKSAYPAVRELQILKFRNIWELSATKFLEIGFRSNYVT